MNHGYFENRSYKIILPADFIAETYKKLNLDLLETTNEDLISHYMNHGYFENRNYKITLPADFIAETYKKLNIEYDINLLNKNNEELISHYIEIGYFLKYEYKIILPIDFDPIIYKNLNNDLIDITNNNDLIYHYINIGYFKKKKYKIIESPYKNNFSVFKIDKKNNINKYTIYSERCSGTTYLLELMKINFNINLSWKYGRQHFFGFNNLENSDDTLFICLVRDIHTWLNSLFRIPHHLYGHKLNTVNGFLNSEIFSVDHIHTDLEILEDRNIYTKKKYKNIFELRHTKLKFLIDDLPLKVKNYIFIRYEDLNNDFENIMNKIRSYNIPIKNSDIFPLNSYKYKNENKKFIENKNYSISKDIIYNHPSFNVDYEKKINYI